MNKIKLFFKQHYVALILAVAVGFISLAPQLLAISSLGESYKGIPFFGVDDNLYYTAKIQDVVDGHWAVSSPFLFEYKNTYPLVLPIGEFFYVILSGLFFLSVTKAVLLAKFLFPAVLFFLIYLLILKIINKNAFLWSGKINSIMGGLLVVLGFDFIDYKNTWLFISGQSQRFFLSVWTRPVNPVTGAMLLFIFLLLVWRIINYDRTRSRFMFLPAGLILGLMIYYFFSWGTAMSVLGVLIIIFFIKKEQEIFRQLFFTAFTGFLIVLPYWCGLWFFVGGENWQKTSAQNGMFYTHQLLPNKVLLASLLIFLPCLIYELYKKSRTGRIIENWWWFSLSFLLGGLLALNQQILTGRTIWPYHFVQYTAPLAMVALVILFFNFIKPRLPNVWRLGVAVFFIFISVFVFVAIRNFSYGEDDRVGDMEKLQKYSGALEWLNDNTPRDSVVLTKDPESSLSTLIPALTGDNTYWTNWFPLSLIPPERVYHNYLVFLRINEINPNGIRNYLQQHQQELRSSFFADWDMIFDTSDSEYINKKIEQVAGDYQEFIKKDFTTELKKYRIDYIVSVGPLSQGIRAELSGLIETGNSDDIFIYKF